MASSSPPKYASVVGSQFDLTQPPYEDVIIIRDDDSSSSSTPDSADSLLQSERVPLLSSPTPSVTYGATPISYELSPAATRRILFNAAMKMAALFIVSTIVLGGTLWLALPTLEEEDRPRLRVPKTFAQLQDLNFLLKKYRDIYPFRIVVCYILTYQFLQAFSLPGSMYLSILGGAVWGVPRALPLACACVATGATLCYLIAAALGPALLALPKWKARLDAWRVRVGDHRDNIISYLIVLRMAPFPPHWVINVLAPHLGIGIIPFWISTFLGVVGISVIHTTIGNGLDDMTSADDFHLISWRNFLFLSAVVVGVMIPVGLKYIFRRQGTVAPDADADVADIEEDTLLAQGPTLGNAKGKQSVGHSLILLQDSDESDIEQDVLEEEEDEILESGPTLVPDIKGKSSKAPSPSSSVKHAHDWPDVSF